MLYYGALNFLTADAANAYHTHTAALSLPLDRPPPLSLPCLRLGMAAASCILCHLVLCMHAAPGW